MQKLNLREFELRIIETFKSFQGGKAGPRKGVWIRGHLEVEDWVYGMWQRWQEFCHEAGELGAKIEPGSYTAFNTYVWLLKVHGLVFPTRRERGKSPRPKFIRTYYCVNPRRLDDPLWLNPFAGYASWQAQRKRGFPKKRVKHGKRGRPPKYFKE